MAIYHCSIKAISRGAGQSVIAAAAYRHCCKMTDSQTGQVHDYSRKKGLESSDLYFPSGVEAPLGAHDFLTTREKLWNLAEASEKRCNARVGREVELSLPSELTSEQRRQLAGDFARHLAERYKVAVDVAIHLPGRQGDQRNYHAHMLLSSRRITADGFGEKTRELDDKKRGPEEVEIIRAEWARLCNLALERAGQNAQVDHRSLKSQGRERAATCHLGKSATAMERKGIATVKGDKNKRIEQINAEYARLKKRRIALDRAVVRIRDIQSRAKESSKINTEAAIQQPGKQTQEASRAQSWIFHRESLRQKEKEAEKAAKEFFERATEYEGRNGLFEAQKAYERIPLLQRIFLDKKETIKANVQEFYRFASDCRKKGEESEKMAKEYAVQGFNIALAHPEARDNNDQIAIARMNSKHKEEEGREQERQEIASRKAKFEAIENSGYRGELNSLARIAKPNVIQKALDDWKKPYLDLIQNSHEDQNVIEWCLSRARYDASPEGQAELKGIKNVLEESLKSTGWSLSKKWSLVEPAMDTIRVQKNRQFATQEALRSIQQQVSQELSRGRGR